VAVDPIEKKPFRRFHPGTYILSVGSYGCNLHCPFCQNHEISMAGPEAPVEQVSPERLAGLAAQLTHAPQGNIGVAFTYNEPLISYEYVLDTARLLKEKGLCTVLVTNGMLAPEPLQQLLPLVDAMNIDLKGFSQTYYDWLGGDFATVQHTIAAAAAQCHVEVTTLIVPGKNDAPEDMQKEAAWLAQLSPELPLHISRFFPRYELQNLPATPVETIEGLCRIAGEQLKYVYAGNC
jgi:pyruvate formate lyase activating enzyme